MTQIKLGELRINRHQKEFMQTEPSLDVKANAFQFREKGKIGHA